jgi:hypothetical protein
MPAGYWGKVSSESAFSFIELLRITWFPLTVEEEE